MAKMGRPTKLHHRVEVKDPGVDTPRISTVADRIIELVRRTGMTPSLAGRAAGVSAEAVWSWIRKGREHRVELERGKPMYAHELALVDFVQGVDEARGAYLAEQLDLHEQIARGGLVIQEITQEVDPTIEVTRADGTKGPKVLKSKTKSTRLLPDVKALQWNIERKSRAVADPLGGEIVTPDEGLGARVEVTGEGGGPVEVDDKRERARQMLAEIEAFKRGAHEGAEREAEKAGAD